MTLFVLAKIEKFWLVSIWAIILRVFIRISIKIMTVWTGHIRARAKRAPQAHSAIR